MKKQEDMNDLFAKTSFLYGGNADYIEQLYAQYEKDPTSVDIEWRNFFSGFSDTKEDVLQNAKGASWQAEHWPVKENGELVSALDGDWSLIEKAIQKKLVQEGKADKKASNHGASSPDFNSVIKESMQAMRLINAYRSYGHLKANLDPLGLDKMRKDHQMLALETYGFSQADFDKKIYLGGVLGYETASLRDILARLESLYCGKIGVEYMHITDSVQRKWIQDEVEMLFSKEKFTKVEKKALLSKLIEAEGFEQFLDTKYKGAKRFGLDGGESLIPALEQLILRAGEYGVEEVVFGMAHRGRLNVLSQILGKQHRAIFHEFKGGSYKPDDVEGSGDVKYHLGASSDRNLETGNIHLSLVPNPSHLEIVNPVVLGKTRARQDSRFGNTRAEIIPINARTKALGVLLHGDAAFSGQGVVQEILGLSNLSGYSVAGSIHIIINNQIGFTTNPSFSRSTAYPSDVAKMIETPIFHVNGDDPEAVAFVTRLAMDYRQVFHRPVIIDLYCYRRYGHNEGDEPFFTQPVMYKAIRSHKTVGQLYSEQLIGEKVITQEEFEELKSSWREKLEQEFKASESYKPEKADWLEGKWTGLKTADHSDEQRNASTAVSLETLKTIGKQLVFVPENFKLHKTVQRFIDHRTKMIESGEGLDWAMGEALAFGSLVLEGIPIRLAGEDVERGTFSQRHSVFYDQETEERYVPLNHLGQTQAVYQPINSLLSEEAALGYEYGYSIANPMSLTLWEAQFGDFANGAQVVFDQFISSAERKWLRMSGLVCLLPHGFEGQGPEHSSARLERYLQLCAEDNMQVANCTTPANYFHILRRQMKRDFRKPLILMTPKSLLRHKRAVSGIGDLSGNTSFQLLLCDDAERLKNQAIKLQKDAKIRRVVLCTGKVYYDLYEEREKRGIDDVYLLRVEQLYPFPAKAMAILLARFSGAEIVWCQEEPKNMGAWSFIEPYLEWVLTHIGSTHKRASYVGRPASASPAAGLMSEHLKQLASFLEDALA